MLTMTRLHLSCHSDCHAVFQTQQRYIFSSRFSLSPADAGWCVFSKRIGREETTKQWLGEMCVWIKSKVHGRWPVISRQIKSQCASRVGQHLPPPALIYSVQTCFQLGSTFQWEELFGDSVLRSFQKKKKKKRTRWVNCGLVVQNIKIHKNNNQEILISQKKRSFHENIPESKHFQNKTTQMDPFVCVITQSISFTANHFSLSRCCFYWPWL